MKRRILLILTCVLLVAAMLVTTVGCGNVKKGGEESDTVKETGVVTEANKDDKDTTAGTEAAGSDVEDTGDVTDLETEEDTEEDTEEEENETEIPLEYNVEPEDLNGFQLDILTVKEKTWSMHTDLAPVAITGDTINRAVYKRNNTIQNLYNAKIVAYEDAEYYGMSERISKDLLSQEYKYDAAYSEGSSVMSLITQDSLYNLYDVDEIQLDEAWWSQLIKEECTLGTGKYSTLFFSQSNLSLTAFDLTWCVYFNKTIHETEQVEDLYALVENDQWTIEKMATIGRNVATLNSDTNYTYEDDGTSVYGITTYWNGAKAMLDGGNVAFVTVNTDGDPVPNINNDRFINLSQKLAEMFGEAGTFTNGGASTDSSSKKGNASDYIKIFNAQRALFCVAEVKSSVSDFKDLDNFGILPLPKYDDSQEEFRSWVNYLAPVLVIPKSHDESENTLHNTAVLLDALSFYSSRDVLPEYYDVVLKGRGTNDSNSIKMLDLINDTKSFDASIAYGWSRQFSEVLSETILLGVTDVSSLVGTYEEMITNNIKDTMDAIYND